VHLLFVHSWGSASFYNATSFKKFFKIPIGLFDDYVSKVTANDDYSRQKTDAAGKMGLSLQKICSADRQLKSGVSSAEHNDKYCMLALTGLEAMKRFCHSIIAVYKDEALCHPNAVDIGRLLKEGCAAGFPGCKGLFDCMHWEWENCLSGWKGVFQGKSDIPTVVLDAKTDNCCQFWHFNFSSPGALNDLNIMDCSSLFDNAICGQSPSVNFVVNRSA
jgi:hypothetical protein